MKKYLQRPYIIRSNVPKRLLDDYVEADVDDAYANAQYIFEFVKNKIK